ncbi:MAG: hypothetical protein NTZ37_02115 [Methanoregula sp.]|nr:hypothetical protein [Methanoregula sp.]
MNPKRVPARATDRLHEGAGSVVTRYLLLIALAVSLVAVPVSAEDSLNSSALHEPAVVHIGVYVVNFNRFSVEEGRVEANFYVNLKSDTPVSINDFEIMNGQITSVDTIIDTPHEKEYRIIAALTVDPDLRRYPFDRHTLPIRIEPKFKNEQGMVLVIDPAESGLDPEADLPGWGFTGTSSAVTNKSYAMDENPYSRAVFNYGIGRDRASTVLKFFLPIMLIIIVSLSSLVMKVTSRLGLNASMFLAAVLIHWRIADAIPLVAYATFLDFFMIITYATLVMVLVSGILIIKFTEGKDTARVDQVYRWSIRIVPVLSIVLYSLLFLTLMV